jgi:hypothetical protein
MGVEGYFLLRFGDAGFYEEQLQIALNGSFGGNWPARDDAMRLPRGEWLHIALTYDLGSNEMIVYINGRVQSRGIRGTASSVNFARNDFYIGRSFNDNRSFHGEICEVRIWNTVRSQADLNSYRYEVEPKTPGLLAYWKFDEGEGNIINDATGNGNNLGLASPTPIRWVPVQLGGE